jgi:hypothetical protein
MPGAFWQLLAAAFFAPRLGPAAERANRAPVRPSGDSMPFALLVNVSRRRLGKPYQCEADGGTEPTTASTLAHLRLSRSCSLFVSAVEVHQRKPGTKLDKRKGGRCAGRVRLAIVPDRSAESLCGFVECAVVPRTSLVTDEHLAIAGADRIR